MIFIILEFGNGPDICCSIIQGDSFNYHHRNVRSRVSVSNFQVSVSAFMTKSRSRSRLESWARSRTRRLRSRLYHCNTQIYVTWTSNNGVISSGDLYYCLLPQCEALHTCRSSFLIKTQEIFFLLFHSPNTCNIYLDLNLATFQYIDGFWCFFFAWTDFDWNWQFFWTLSQLSVQFWDYLFITEYTLIWQNTI